MNQMNYVMAALQTNCFKIILQKKVLSYINNDLVPIWVKHNLWMEHASLRRQISEYVICIETYCDQKLKW